MKQLIEYLANWSGLIQEKLLDGVSEGDKLLSEQRKVLNETVEILEKYYHAEEQGQLVILPCKVGDAVYHICKCKDIRERLDGTLYDSNGEYDTATGYYCPYKDSCPHDTEDCNSYKNMSAIFRDVVIGFCFNDDANVVSLENTPCLRIEDFGKIAFLKLEKAEAALATQIAEKENKDEINIV